MLFLVDLGSAALHVCDVSEYLRIYIYYVNRTNVHKNNAKKPKREKKHTKKTKKNILHGAHIVHNRLYI